MAQRKVNKTSFKYMIMSFFWNWAIIFQMSKREVLGRYRGSMMGLAWSFFNPLLMLAVYTIFFSVIFKARWGGEQAGGHVDFAIVLFVGLIVHGLFAECLNRAPHLMSSNVNYVKKVVFPLETLPWIAMGSALFHASIGLVVLLAIQLITDGRLPWTAIFFPVILLPLIFATMGFSWFLASMGVYVRDLGQMTTSVTAILLFLSPIFYPISILPPHFQTLVLLNPLTLIIEQSRLVLIYEEMPDWISLGVYGVFSVLIAWLGFWWFQKTRKGFADVL